MCPKTSSRHNNSMCSDVVSDVNSSQTSRCNTPVLSDTDTSSTEAAGSSNNQWKQIKLGDKLFHSMEQIPKNSP